MSNRNFILFSLLMVVIFSTMSLLKEEKEIEGNIISVGCINTAKSRVYVELIMNSKLTKKRFIFNVKNYACMDAIKLFSKGDSVKVVYGTLKGRFITVRKLYLNDNRLFLSGDDENNIR